MIPYLVYVTCPTPMNLRHIARVVHSSTDQLNQLLFGPKNQPASLGFVAWNATRKTIFLTTVESHFLGFNMV